MSEVLEFLRERAPELKDVSDDELTRFAGESYPELLGEDTQFSRDYSMVAQSASRRAVVPMPGQEMRSAELGRIQREDELRPKELLSLAEPSRAQQMEEIGKEGERPQFFPERKPIFGETPAVAGQRERLAELEPRVKYLEQMQREGNATIEDPIRRQAFNEQIDDEFRALGVTPLKLDGDVRVPRVTAGEVRTLFPAIGEGGAKVAAGLQQAAADVAEGVLSPWGIATFGLGALEPAAAKPMMQAFVLDKARNSPEQAMEAAEALRKGDTERATRSIANLLATGYFI